MGKYIVNLSEKAEKDLKKIHQSGDKNSIKKIERIFKELDIFNNLRPGNYFL